MPTRSLPPWFAWLLLVPWLGAPGCGEEPAPRRDPTLRGLIQRLEARGLTLGPGPRLDMVAEQRARVGRAAGLANELAGAGLKDDLPTETSNRTLGGLVLRLERYASVERAAGAHALAVAQEARRPDPGKLVSLLAGDIVATLEGAGAAAGSQHLPMGLKARPAHPPPPEVVARLEAALAADQP